MTTEKLKTVMESYRGLFYGLGIKPEQVEDYDDISTGPGARLAHAAWMVDHVLEHIHEDHHHEKWQRWLGFVQGVLWTTNKRSIASMKGDNRPTLAAS